MESLDFSWNEFEQSLFKQGKWEIPSKYKIKVNDCPEKRKQLELILYKMPHKQLAIWAIKNAKPFLDFINLDDNSLKDSIIRESTEALNKRIDGEISAYNLRSAGFLANKLAQLSKNDLSKYAARVFAQAIATGHMRGHAIVSSDYAIKVINMLYYGNMIKVMEERDRQIELANEILIENYQYGSK